MTAYLLTAGGNVAFGVVFGAFIIAFVVLSFITVRWAIRRDRAGRKEWLRRVTQTGDGVGPRANGRRAAPGRESGSGKERRGER
ncbi:MAG TPA: hypothetical protein VK277_14100 [Acidimicrobiales bacterium]|nr:hypothetical protein [Acidimicrobiales bacterium]